MLKEEIFSKLKCCYSIISGTALSRLFILTVISCIKLLLLVPKKKKKEMHLLVHLLDDTCTFSLILQDFLCSIKLWSHVAPMEFAG